MELQQAIELIQHPDIKSETKQVWADLGSGAGLFTRALAALLADGSTVYAVDQNKSSLQQIQRSDTVDIKTLPANFVKDELGFQDMDGILMANALHFVQDKIKCLQKLAGYCRPQHRFIIVEYDTDVPNPWVPYPLAFTSLKRLVEQCGYTSIHKIQEVPSRYGRSNIYSAIIQP